jgi:hypothetical protein
VRTKSLYQRSIAALLLRLHTHSSCHYWCSHATSSASICILHCYWYWTTTTATAIAAVTAIEQDEASFSLQQRLPYLILADCLINTAVRDGLNRLPLEFAVAHTARRYVHMQCNADTLIHTNAAAIACLHQVALTAQCWAYYSHCHCCCRTHDALVIAASCHERCACAFVVLRVVYGQCTVWDADTKLSLIAMQSCVVPVWLLLLLLLMHRRECPGVVMLSEFTSCMRVLRGAVRINPWKVDEVAAAMIMVLVSTYSLVLTALCSLSSSYLPCSLSSSV